MWLLLNRQQQRQALNFNRTKCDIIMDDYSKISMEHTFKDFIRNGLEKLTLFGSHISQGKAQDATIIHHTQGYRRR